MSDSVEIEIGTGRVGLRNCGYHLVLTHGRKNKSKVFKVPDKFIGKEIRLVMVVISDSEEKS